MQKYRVGVQLSPQHTTYASYIDAVQRIDALGVDTIWNWDHFFPLSGEPDGAHFECYTLLTAIAIQTANAQVGCLVTCNSYRNPQLLADMARTIDHICNGRFILGIGAGWCERDYVEYGYDFGTFTTRLQSLDQSLPLIKQRWEKLNPAPLRSPIPILIGGGGEKKTLRIVAQYADMWNCIEPPEVYSHKNAVLDRWCAELGRDPAEIERTVALSSTDLEQLDAFVEAGATHMILFSDVPVDFKAVEQLVNWRERQPH